MPAVAPDQVLMDVPPWRLSGNVYGTLLNHRGALAELGNAIDAPPYRAAPKSVVLYVKPRNTLNIDGGNVVVPADAAELQIGANLGVVIGRTACHVDPDEAMRYIAGYVIVNDISVPHLPYYRPSIRFKARDGFCPLGPRVTARSAVADPGALAMSVRVDGELRQTASTADLIRPVATLLAAVTEFMTLSPGDVLATGTPGGAPRARAGQEVAVEITGLGSLRNRLVGAHP